MARAQRITTPVRISGSLSDLGVQQWTMTLNKSGFIVPTRTVTATGTITEDDRVVFANPGANISLEVYNTSSNDGAMVTIKRIDTTDYIVTITTEGADKIDGQDEIYLQAQYDSVTLVSDGGNWYII
tara:strand:- start:880 stop:1260 length:381 start_codon:yes stop_codon:yes gene_type:complete